MKDKNSISEIWSRFNKIRDDFFLNIELLAQESDLEKVIQQSFTDPTNTSNALLLLEMLSCMGYIEPANRFTREIVNIALVGNVTNIVLARHVLSKMNKTELLKFLEKNIHDITGLHIKIEGEEWVYRRLMELYQELNLTLLQKKLVEFCKESNNKDLMELGSDFS